MLRIRSSTDIAFSRDLRPSSIEGKRMRILLALALMLSAGSAFAAHDMQAIINTCWQGHDHAGMSACVAGQAQASLLDLAQTENALRLKIRTGAYDPAFPSYQTDALERLDAASSAFKLYRTEHCAFQVAIASKGNAAEDIRKACEAVLNEDRADQLRATRPWL
jgi:uncharacterized protein YecT (DUF1311 family)